MSPSLDVFVITNNEEELLTYCLESYTTIADLIGVCSIVDNNSTDATLDIIESYKDRLPIVLQHHRDNAHHGEMRTKAISVCKSPYIFYLDSDETFTSDFRNYILSEKFKSYGMSFFFKYTTILDRNHYVMGGNGHTQRLFRNDNGSHFPQSIHTEPTSPQGWGSTDWLPEDGGPLLFDHTSCKSWEALWGKGWRYQWAKRENVPAIGPAHEYVGRVEHTRPETIAEFPDSIKNRIFTGPETSLCLEKRIG